MKRSTISIFYTCINIVFGSELCSSDHHQNHLHSPHYPCFAATPPPPSQTLYRLKVYIILLITFKALFNFSPPYLSKLPNVATPFHSLRSASCLHLSVLPVRLVTMGSRAVSRSAPWLWNSLPSDIRNLDSLPLFKSRLKTHLFRIAYPT